jgi:cytochrome b subunit of formate dehydrogenase
MRAIQVTVLFSIFGTVICISAQTNCFECHDHGQKLARSTHAAIDCQSCHDGVKAYPHTAPVTKLACVTCHEDAVKQFEAGAHARLRKAGNEKAPTCASCHNDVHETRKAKDAAFRQDVPKVCGTCHAEISKQYQASVHGTLLAQGDQASASCTTCHGAHTNLPPRDPESLVSARNLRQTCASCHENVALARRFQLPLDKVTTFDQSFHGLAAKTGSQTVANCASCHGIHNILPASDPKSTIHPANLKETCGHCHPGASERFANAKMHRTEKEGQPTAVLVIRAVYLILIPATITLMLLHQGGDFLRKLKLLQGRTTTFGPRQGEIRMHLSERYIHALMAISFVVLVLTGFALRYPDAWWAEPMVMWESTWPVRGTLHRVAAVAILIAGFAHIAGLILNRKLREHWNGLLPRWSDFPQGWGTFLYNLRLRKTKPALPHHSYVAKVEYWAVVWGTAVMALTGFLLWANKYTFQWIPREWLDAAAALHFYEAILATFAVIVWHFYTVILDPEVYPIDPAFLTGKSGRREITVAEEPAVQETPDGE